MELNLSFENLPKAVNELSNKLDAIQELLFNNSNFQNSSKNDSVIWFNLNDLVAYDPAKRVKATFYSKISKGEIPFHKDGKHLMFLKSEIDEWLKSGKHKCNAEIEAEADAYLNKKRGSK